MVVSSSQSWSSTGRSASPQGPKSRRESSAQSRDAKRSSRRPIASTAGKSLRQDRTCWRCLGASAARNLVVGSRSAFPPSCCPPYLSLLTVQPRVRLSVVPRECRRDVCLKHRFASDHMCAKLQLVAARTRSIAPHKVAAQLRNCGLEESSSNRPESLVHDNGNMTPRILAR